jgi:N-acylglucosamine 2-epimerase
MNENLKRALREIENHLANGIIPFWVGNGFDEEFGGFLTCFDSDGKRTSDTNKYIVTQTRMIWGLSALYAEYGKKRCRLFYRTFLG